MNRSRANDMLPLLVLALLAIFGCQIGGGEEPPSSESDHVVKGQVWSDDNKNGLQEEGEEFVPGVTVRLYSESFDETGRRILLGEYQTDENGSYLLLVPQEYNRVIVALERPEGKKISPVDQGDDDTKDSDFDPYVGTIVVPATSTNIDAGLYEEEVVEAPSPTPTATSGPPTATPPPTVTPPPTATSTPPPDEEDSAPGGEEETASGASRVSLLLEPCPESDEAVPEGLTTPDVVIEDDGEYLIFRFSGLGQLIDDPEDDAVMVGVDFNAGGSPATGFGISFILVSGAPIQLGAGRATADGTIVPISTATEVESGDEVVEIRVPKSEIGPFQSVRIGLSNENVCGHSSDIAENDGFTTAEALNPVLAAASEQSQEMGGSFACDESSSACFRLPEGATWTATGPQTGIVTLDESGRRGAVQLTVAQGAAGDQLANATAAGWNVTTLKMVESPLRDWDVYQLNESGFLAVSDSVLAEAPIAFAVWLTFSEALPAEERELWYDFFQNVLISYRSAFEQVGESE